QRTIYLFCILHNIKNEFPIRSKEYVSTKQTNNNSMPDSVSGCKQAYKNKELLSTFLKKELHYQILGNSKKESSRSDFAYVAIFLNTKKYYFFFILEFEVDGVWIHKDFEAVVAEAVYTLNCILSTYIILESEISK
ncbi:6861_t:CDS:2, partial [Dentiscutata erythropus]